MCIHQVKTRKDSKIHKNQNQPKEAQTFNQITLREYQYPFKGSK